MNHSDIIIIGSGPGGYRTALYAAQNGLNVIIIEKAELGGTCLNSGCIPTKTLCRNAEVIDIVKSSNVFGIENDICCIDFTKAMERKQSVIKDLRNGIETLMQSPGITLIRGVAHFKGPKTIIVDNEEYSANKIIIATGSEAKIPPIDGINLRGVLSSKELLDINYIPEHLCIIGAGVIGMEFASIFNSFGSKVTVIEYLKECLPLLDSDIAKRLRQTLGRRGVDFAMQSVVKSIMEKTDENGYRKLTLLYEKKGKVAEIDADAILIATGRKPNIEGLELEKAGVQYSPKGIATDNRFQTNVEGIYAIGDVNGRCMLAHAATFQGLHVINEIIGKKDNIDFSIMPSAIFTYPEAACVGASEESLKAEHREYKCHKGFYRSNGKALAMSETEGMIKLLVDACNNRIIGCHAFGAHSSDIVQEVSVMMNMGATMENLADTIHIHPTLSEILHDIAL